MTRAAQKEQTLGELLVEFWHGRYFILTGLMLALVLGAGFLFVAQPHHKAVMILAPSEPMTSAAQYKAGGEQAVGSLIPQDQGDHLFVRFQASYKGAAVAALLLRDEEILEGLQQDQAFLFSQGQREWNAEQLADYISRRVIISSIGETELREFSFMHADPVFARMFLERLHETTDGLIRYAIRRDVNERVIYIRDALSKANNPEHRRAYTDLLMEQERLKMLVSTPQPYAALVVELAYTQAKLGWPKPMLVMAAFALSGVFIGFIVYSLFALKGGQREERTPLQRQARKMREWVKTGAGNSNHQKTMRRYSSDDAAE